MPALARRRSRRGVVVLLLCLLSVCAVATFLLAANKSYTNVHSVLIATKPLPSFLFDEEIYLQAAAKEHDEGEKIKLRNHRPCTMAECFDLSRCLSGFKVYVYQPSTTTKTSFLYKRILRVIRNSRYFTDDPDKACLFVPSLDTLDRDRLSNEYINDMGKRLAQLRHWNDGRNHLIFNLYSGTWPTYAHQLDFSYGNAILAKSSFSDSTYRTDYDVSIPLLHKNHREKAGEGGMLRGVGNLLPVWRKYLVIFKGKRYLYGIGSETRNALYHLHNGKDILVLTTCKHGRDWDRMQDIRCNNDNKMYDKYDYSQLMINATFCLVPRGRRLGSFRLIEVLQASCIPLSFSNGYVLPFSEVIDWRKASVSLDERQLFDLPHIARSISGDRILSMRMHTQFLWDNYFSSVEKVVYTTLEIIRQRVSHTLRPFLWNVPPGGLHSLPSFSHDLSAYPFYSPMLVARGSAGNYTAIIMAKKPSQSMDSPLIKLIDNLCSAAHLQKVVVMWAGPGSPEVLKPQYCTKTVVVVERKGLANRLTRWFWPLPAVATDAVLSLSEDAYITADEAELGYSIWQSNPNRLVTLFGSRNYWDPVLMKWAWSSLPSNEYSTADWTAMFLHRYHGFLFTQSLPPAVKQLSDSSTYCLNLAMNFMISIANSKSPIKFGPRTSIHHQDSLTNVQSEPSDDGSCVNVLMNTFGRIPLFSSVTRADRP